MHRSGTHTKYEMATDGTLCEGENMIAQNIWKKSRELCATGIKKTYFAIWRDLSAVFNEIHWSVESIIYYLINS